MPNITNVTLGTRLDLSAAERQIKQFEGKTITLNFRTSQPLGRLTGDVGEFEKSMAAANARVIAFGASAGIISGVSLALHAMVTESIAVDKALTGINATMNLTTSQLKGFGDSLFGIAKNTGSSFAEVAKQAEQFSHSGLQMSEVLHRTSDAMILARISGLDAATAYKELTAEINSFAREGLTTTQIVDRLAAASSRFGVNAKDLSEAISGIGEAASDAKVGFNELIALVTRVQQTTSKGGAEIGVALKTIFSRVERKDTLDSLDQLGVSVRDLRGQTLPAIEILGRLASTYDRLGDAQKEQVAELLGGVRQVAILKTALGDLNSSYSVYRNVLDATNNAAGAASLRNEELNRSIAALANAAGANFTKLAAAGGNAVFGPSIKRVLGAFNDASDAASGEGVGQTIGAAVLKGIGNALAGPGLVAGGFLAAKLLGNFASFAAKAATTVLDIGKASEQTSRVQSGINSLLEQTPGLYERILNQARSITEQEEILLGVIKQRIAAQSQGQAVVSNLSENLAERGVDFNLNKRAFVAEGRGYVPNFVSEIAKRAEIASAASSGYSVNPSQVKGMVAKIDGRSTNVVYNDREEVIPNFAGTGEPAIIPPGKTIASLMMEKARNRFVPNYALNVLEFGDEAGAIGLKKSRSSTYSLEDFLLKSFGETETTNPSGFLNIPTLKSNELSKVRFKSLFNTSSVEGRLGDHQQAKYNRAAGREYDENNILSKSSLRRLNRLNGAVDRLKNEYLQKNGAEATPQQEGGFFEDALVEVYGKGGRARRFFANNARQDFRRGLNISDRAINTVAKDFGLPQDLINLDLKRTIARQTVGASLTAKTVYGSGFGNGQLQEIIKAVGQVKFSGRPPEEAEALRGQLRDVIFKRQAQAQTNEYTHLSNAGDLSGYLKKNPRLNQEEFFNRFAGGFVPNYALEPDVLERTRAAAKALRELRGTPQLPEAMFRQMLNVSAEGGLRFGVPSSRFLPKGLQLGGYSSSLESLPLRFTQDAQLGAIYAPQTYEELGGLRGGVTHLSQDTPHINLLDSKAFQRNPVFGNPEGLKSGPNPFRSYEEFQNYLVEKLNGQGFSGLAQTIKEIRNPNYRLPKDRGTNYKPQPELLKEGLGLHVSLRNLPILNIENTRQAGAYRDEIRARNLHLRKGASPAEYGDVVNTVIERAVEKELGAPRSKNARIDVPKNLVEKVLGVDSSVAPLGVDAKSSLEKFVVRELISKGNSQRAGLDVFQRNLAQSVAGSGISQAEQNALSSLFNSSSNLFAKARGFVPNLVARQVSGIDAVSGGLTHSIGGLSDAISRETTGTGISLSQVRVNFAKNSGEPPVSVTNTRDEGFTADPNIGFSRIRKAGGNIFLAGSGKEFGRGFIPNFALETPQSEEDITRIVNELVKNGTIRGASQANKVRARLKSRLAETSVPAVASVPPPNPGTHPLSVEERLSHINDVLSTAESESNVRAYLRGNGGRGKGNIENHFVEQLGKNYAEGFSKEQAAAVRERAGGVNARRANVRSSATQGLFAASFLIPTVGGALAQTLPEGQGRRNVEGISSAIGQGVSIAALGGGNPAALAAGALLAIYQTTKTINENLKPSFEDLAKKAQELSSKNQQQIQAASGVIQAQSAIEEAQKSGNVGQVRIASTQYNAAVSALTDPELKRQFAGAKTVEDKSKILADFQVKAQEQNFSGTAQAQSAQFAQKFSSGFIDSSVGNFIGTRHQKVNDKSINELEKLAQVLVAAGDAGKGVEDKIKENLDPQFKALFDTMVGGLRRAQEAATAAAKTTADYQAEVAGLNTILSKLSTTRTFQTDITNIGNQSRNEINTNRVKQLSNLYSPYLSETAKANIDYQGTLRENESTRNEGLQGVQESIQELFENVRTNNTGLNPSSVKDLQTSVLEKGGAGLQDVQKLISLATADKSKTDEGQLAALYKIESQLVGVNAKFETGNTIARDNFAYAKAQITRNKNAAFLGGNSLEPLDTSPYVKGAEGTLGYIQQYSHDNPTQGNTYRSRNGSEIVPASLFDLTLKNARENSSDYGAVGKVLANRNQENDGYDIARAGEVRAFYKDGLGATSGPEYDAARETDRRGIAAHQYQSLEAYAGDKIGVFQKSANLDVQTQGAITNALGSRSPEEVQKAIEKLTSYNETTVNQGSRTKVEGASALQIIDTLKTFKNGLGRVDASSKEIAARDFQSDDVPKAVADLNSQIKSDNEVIAGKFDGLIARAEAIARNTLDIDSSIKSLTQLSQAQQKIVATTDAANQNKEDLKKEADTQKGVSDAEVTSQKSLLALDQEGAGDAFASRLKDRLGSGFDLTANRGLKRDGEGGTVVTFPDQDEYSRLIKGGLSQIKGGASKEDVADQLNKQFSDEQSVGYFTGLPVGGKDFRAKLLAQFNEDDATKGVLSQADKQKNQETLAASSARQAELLKKQPGLDTDVRTATENRTRLVDNVKADTEKAEKEKAAQLAAVEQRRQAAADVEKAQAAFDAAKPEEKDAAGKTLQVSKETLGKVDFTTNALFRGGVPTLTPPGEVQKRAPEYQKSVDEITRAERGVKPRPYNLQELRDLDNGAPSETNPFLGKLRHQVSEIASYHTSGLYDDKTTTNKVQSLIADSLKPAEQVARDTHDSGGQTEIGRLIDTLAQLIKTQPVAQQQQGATPQASTSSTTTNVNVDSISVAANTSFDSDKFRADLQAWVKSYIDSDGKPLPAVQTPTGTDASGSDGTTMAA